MVIRLPLDVADTPHDGITDCDECHNGTADQVVDAAIPNAKCLVCHGAGGGATLAAAHQAPSGTDCVDCHNVMRSQGNAKHIKGTVNGQVVSFTGTGPADYTYQVGDGSGLCEVCHTSTLHYQSDGSGTAHHANDCLSCHTHESGIVIPAVLNLADVPHDGITNCDECHNGIVDQVAGATLDNAKCLVCHGNGGSATEAAAHFAPTGANCTD